MFWCFSFVAGDVIRARNGKTTEITNTDAEGRLGNLPILLFDVLKYIAWTAFQ